MKEIITKEIIKMGIIGSVLLFLLLKYFSICIDKVIQIGSDYTTTITTWMTWSYIIGFFGFFVLMFATVYFFLWLFEEKVNV